MNQNMFQQCFNVMVVGRQSPWQLSKINTLNKTLDFREKEQRCYFTKQYVIILLNVATV